MKIQKAPTIKDVAQKSGVSLGTASHALSGKAFVQPETLEKVLAAAKSLGYQKNHSAQLLVSRKGTSQARTGNIGLLFAEMGEDWSDHPLASAFFFGVEAALRNTGFHPLVEYLGGRAEMPRAVREGKVDGLVVKLTRPDKNFFEFLPRDLPVVAIGPAVQRFPVSQVSSHDEAAGTSMTQHLWEKGHRRIAFVSMESSHPMFLLRYLGYESFLRNAKAFDPDLVWMSESRSSGDEPQETPPDLTPVVERFISLKKKPTAILAANDWMAAGLYRALKAAGLRIPEDVSVVGFDNMAGLCGAMDPPLTSFQIPFVQLAKRAAEILLTLIEDPEKIRTPSLELLYGTLVERKSVKEIK